MKLKILMAAVLLAPTAGCATGPVEARSTLKKWGLAHCLSTYGSSESIRQMGARAQGAYFQRGSHNDEAAYERVRSFYADKFKQMSTASQDGGEPLVLVGCLDIYEAPDYDEVLEQQDRFLEEAAK